MAVKLGRLLALLLALALMLTACPADDDDVDVVEEEPDVPEEPVDVDEPDDEPAPDPDGEPLRIGIVIMLSGVYGQIGEDLVNAMRLYFDTVDNQVAGRPIELLIEDETMEPGTALERTRRLVEVEDVDILSGLISTGSAYAVADFVEQSQVPLVIANAGGNDLSRGDLSPYIIRTSFTNWQNNYAVGEWYYENIGETVALLASDYAAGHEHIGGFLESFEAAGGQVVDEVYTPLGSTDFSAALGRLGASGADGLYGFLAGTDGLIFVRQYDESGLKDQMPLVASGYMVEEDVLEEVGEQALGIFSGLHWAYDLDNEANREFIAAYEEAYGRPPNVYAVQGWDTARVIVEAVEQLGGDTTDAEALIEAMLGISFDSPRGPFGLDPNTHNPVHHVYLREVVEMNGAIHNTVREDLGEFADPGA